MNRMIGKERMRKFAYIFMWIDVQWNWAVCKTNTLALAWICHIYILCSCNILPNDISCRKLCYKMSNTLGHPMIANNCCIWNSHVHTFVYISHTTTLPLSLLDDIYILMSINLLSLHSLVFPEIPFWSI